MFLFSRYIQLFVTSWTAACQAPLSSISLPEFAQIHVHWVSDAIKPPHLLQIPSPFAFNLSQHQSFPMSQLFTSSERSIRASVLPMNIQGLFSLGLTGLISLLSKGLSRVFSSTTLKWVKWSHSVVSDSLWPHRLGPTRLLCPWDFLGNSTGVDCHFFLQGIFPTQGSNPGLPHCR